MASLATQESRPGESADNIAAVAGRGTIYITAAKIWFMVSGYGINFILPRLISKEQFGIYQVVVGVVSVINAVVITCTYQSVSKRISEDEGQCGLVKIFTPEPAGFFGRRRKTPPAASGLKL